MTPTVSRRRVLQGLGMLGLGGVTHGARAQDPANPPPSSDQERLPPLPGTVGLLRFPDSFTRLHALTKADNLGLGLVVLGLLPHVDSLSAGLKLVCIWLLVLLSGATAGQLIARTLNRSGSRS